ncbi:uridine kinase [Cellulomonas sp. URHB0016]
MTRDTVLAAVARHLADRDPGHPLRVGVDGVCGAGKSTFADELAQHVTSLGRPTVRLDSDGFHHVRAIRYRQGRESARGYYEDAYDFDSLRDLALVPLGPGGSGRYATKVHDLRTDEVAPDWALADPTSVVIFDATFLQRDGLRDHWDDVVYLDASTERAQARGTARDAAALGGPDAANAAYTSRYMAACRIYLDEQDPLGRASIVVDHDDPAAPGLVRGLRD